MSEDAPDMQAPVPEQSVPERLPIPYHRTFQQEKRGHAEDPIQGDQYPAPDYTTFYGTDPENARIAYASKDDPNILKTPPHIRDAIMPGMMTDLDAEQQRKARDQQRGNGFLGNSNAPSMHKPIGGPEPYKFPPAGETEPEDITKQAARIAEEKLKES